MTIIEVSKKEEEEEEEEGKKIKKKMSSTNMMFSFVVVWENYIGNNVTLIKVDSNCWVGNLNYL